MRGYPAPVIQDGKALIGDTIISIRNIELDEYIGSGANAFVFVGEDVQLNRRVAVKVWAPRKDRHRARQGVDRSDQARREMQKVARLRDQRIALVYSIDRLPDSGWIYAVMEFIDGDVLRNIRQDLDFQMRLNIWHSVFMALDAAERQGAFHGDLHDGNVIVTNFLGDATLIDFGTSILSGTANSMQRHARMVNEFARKLLPELTGYLPSFDIEHLVTPEYATIAVNSWVDSAAELRKLENDISSLTESELDRRLTTLANKASSTHINVYEPVLEWLTNKGVSPRHLTVYETQAKENLVRYLKARKSQAFRARPVPATKSWITTEWLEANARPDDNLSVVIHILWNKPIATCQ